MKERKLEVSRYDKNLKNPFVEDAIERVNSQIVKRYKHATSTDQNAVLQAFDPSTGELLGHTSFIRQIEVDEEKFAKIYLSEFAAFWDLGKQAYRVFGYILTKLLPKQDLFNFFISECMEHTKYKTHKQVYQGLTQLLDAKIIARGPSDSHYYINPMIVFNGDRVTYAKTYIKKKKEDNPNQIKLPFPETDNNFEK